MALDYSVKSRARSLIEKGGFQFAVLGRTQPTFIIGSMPISTRLLPGHAALAEPKMEIWLPIDPRVAVRPQIDLVGICRIRGTCDADVYATNAATFAQSTMVASADVDPLRYAKGDAAPPGPTQAVA